MGIFTKDIQTMDDLFLRSLQDTYYAEHQITKALPKMIDLATNRDLATGLKSHLEETKGQIARLEQSSRSSAGSRRPPPARLSMASSRKPMKLPAMLPTRTFSTLPLSPPARQWNIVR